MRAPAKFAPEANASAAAKRKRGDQGEDEDVDDEIGSDEDMSAEDDDEDDDASDADHPGSRSRKAGGRTKKPSSKKPRINGTQPAGSHISRIPSRPKKAVRIEAAEKGTGLFGMCSKQKTVMGLPNRLLMLY